MSGLKSKTLLGLSMSIVMMVTGLMFTFASGASAAKGGKPATATTATCTLTATGVGGQLALNGTGYTQGGSYRVQYNWPSGGIADTGTTADATGAISVVSYAYWSGTYKATVYPTSGQTSAVATCSTTV